MNRLRKIGTHPAGVHVDVQLARLRAQADRLSNVLGASYSIDVDALVLSLQEWQETAGVEYRVVLSWKVFGGTYHQALETIHALLERERRGRFCNLRAGDARPGRYRHLPDVRRLEEKIADRYVSCVAVQLGPRHKGKSVVEARRSFLANEVGLGAVTIGVMLLGDPQLLGHEDDLYIDCPGDLCVARVGSGHERHAPVYMHRGGRLEFGEDRREVAVNFSGSATAFL